MEIRVYYEDTDVGGVVFYANYLKFCERARSEAFFQRGLTPILENGHFVVKELNASYHASAKLGDLLHVRTSLVEVKKVSFKLHQSVCKDKEKIFEMDITLVFIDFNGKVKKFEPVNLELLYSLFT
ncbi:MAG: YbgC/FadM family acyl-CoA thioesterase [Thiovulaceae bacterium]|nr:YbgC/FadM family acyl-CoA thioesterase [Sulfurimonadaceae bacterium]